jgi:hypothetical protein
MTCQISSSSNFTNAGIPVPEDPLWIIQNNCPSGTSLIVLAQVKFLGRGFNPKAMGPRPSPFPVFGPYLYGLI